jgi:hypothetical protein
VSDWQPQVVIREGREALQAAGRVIGEVAEERRSRGWVALDAPSRVFSGGKEAAYLLEWRVAFDRQDTFGVEGEHPGAPALSVKEHERVHAGHDPQSRDERGEIRPCADGDLANLAVRAARTIRL